jgi:Sec7-like guanine-nucleotide exchange factor
MICASGALSIVSYFVIIKKTMLKLRSKECGCAIIGGELAAPKALLQNDLSRFFTNQLGLIQNLAPYKVRHSQAK